MFPFDVAAAMNTLLGFLDRIAQAAERIADSLEQIAKR